MRWRDVETRVDAVLELATDPLFDQVDARVRVDEANQRLARFGLHLLERGRNLCELADLDVTRLDDAWHELARHVTAGPGWDDIDPASPGDAVSNPEALPRLVGRLDRAIECQIADLYHYIEAVAHALRHRADIPSNSAVLALRAAMGSADSLLVVAMQARDELQALGFQTPYTPGRGIRHSATKEVDRGRADCPAEYGVALGTARHATRLLRYRGLVVTIPSKGTYIAAGRVNHQLGRGRNEI